MQKLTLILVAMMLTGCSSGNHASIFDKPSDKPIIVESVPLTNEWRDASGRQHFSQCQIIEVQP